MPELPDILVYLDCLAPRVVGQTLTHLKIMHPFVLRSVAPPPSALDGTRVVGLRRLGKRIVFAFEEDRFLVIHLMIAGRLRWRPPGAKPPGKLALAALEFPDGVLFLTEAGSQRRASLFIVAGEEGLHALDRGGVDVLNIPVEAFATRLRLESHTVKRSLTDPRLFSGIGNAYSDEILHRACLSPFANTLRLSDAEIERLHQAIQDVLHEWIARLRDQAGQSFPEKVTAFHDEMAVHGKFGQPCPVCGSRVQRIVYAANETNYCARCQTGGKLLADRALSRLLRDDWPKSIDELE